MSIEDLDVNEYADSFVDDYVITTDSDDGVITNLTDTSPTEEVTEVTEAPVVEKPTKLAKPEKEVKEHVKTKADYAREVFDRMHGQEGIARKDVITALQDGTNFGDLEPLTKAGAGTYYQNFTKKLAEEKAKTEIAPV